MRKDAWTREELILALNLYWKIPYSKISGSSNPQINEIAPLIGRSPGAVAYKLMNFTSLDAERINKGNKGKSSAGLKDKQIWDEYFGEWEKLAYDSAVIMAKRKNKTLEAQSQIQDDLILTSGKERERIIKDRINQSDFRQRILASYNMRCCITGLDIPSLLVASHIIPWSKDENERLNPRNGLCLNSLHDKAFDRGLITINSDFTIRLSNYILSKHNNKVIREYFLAYEGKQIMLPERFIPSIEFLEYHQSHIFNH